MKSICFENSIFGSTPCGVEIPPLSHGLRSGYCPSLQPWLFEVVPFGDALEALTRPNDL